MEKFSEKVVIITGASSGIGEATAVAFSKQVAKLTICGRNKERLEETAKKCRDNGAEVLQIVGDLSKFEELKPVIDITVSKFSRIDILINNAGRLEHCPISELQLDLFEDLFAILVRAPVFLCKYALPHLKETKGCVVNVSSTASLKTFPLTFNVSYEMFKAALDNFTRGFSAECASYGVRVNSINPGVVKTRLVENSKYTKEQFEKIMENFSKIHKLGFMEPETIADGIVFLCSSSHITGIMLPVDSGSLNA
ncbi:putative oxidoreductase TM_0325 isoform X1 [Styela clava]